MLVKVFNSYSYSFNKKHFELIFKCVLDWMIPLLSLFRTLCSLETENKTSKSNATIVCHECLLLPIFWWSETGKMCQVWWLISCSAAMFPCWSWSSHCPRCCRSDCWSLTWSCDHHQAHSSVVCTPCHQIFSYLHHLVYVSHWPVILFLSQHWYQPIDILH